MRESKSAFRFDIAGFDHVLPLRDVALDHVAQAFWRATSGVDAKTHHASLDINVMEVKNQKLTILETIKQRAPSDTARYCDLQKNPNENKQYEVNI